MKKAFIIISLLLTSGIRAFVFNAPVTFTPIINSGIDCESEGVTAWLSNVNHSDNDDNNKDHMTFALVDARDVVLLVNDASYFNVSSPSDIELQLSLTAITARPVTLYIFDKATATLTPGAGLQQRFDFALNNYELVNQSTFDPYLVGLDSCASVSQLSCPDPLIFKSPLEELVCDLNSVSIDQFQAPLESITLCYPSQTYSTGFGDVNVCQGSCGSGTGCEVVITTPEKVNLTENKLCSSYTYLVTDVDIQNNIFGNCLAQLSGNYYVGANWEGGYMSPFTWFYLIPESVVKWFNMNIKDNCSIDISPYYNLLETSAYDMLVNYYSDHFTNNEGQPFCELN